MNRLNTIDVQELLREQRIRDDHALAKTRGERCAAVADLVSEKLFIAGRINGAVRDELKKALRQELAAELYPGLSVDTV